MDMNSIKRIMEHCIELAKENENSAQYPIASVIVDSNANIIASCRSTLRSNTDPTNHPEIEAIRLATKKLESRSLRGCYLFSTLEPCPMCAAASVWANMKGIVYGATQEDAVCFALTHKSVFSWRQIRVKTSDVLESGTPRLELYEEVLRDACCKLFR